MSKLDELLEELYKWKLGETHKLSPEDHWLITEATTEYLKEKESIIGIDQRKLEYQIRKWVHSCGLILSTERVKALKIHLSHAIIRDKEFPGIHETKVAVEPRGKCDPSNLHDAAIWYQAVKDTYLYMCSELNQSPK